ncbi:MAG: methylthioribulose 1-phosphate dehydratase [Synechococcus sp.]
MNSAQSPQPQQELVDTIHGFAQRGWCDGTGGNFSVVLNQEPLRILMAPSGIDKAGVCIDQLIEVDQHGTVITGQGKASAETALHLMLINAAKARSVLHTHSVKATVLSRLYAKTGGLELQGLEMLKGLRGITSHDTTITIPVVPNDQDIERLSRNSRPLINDAPYSLLVEGHGLYTWGSSLSEAKRHTEITEFLLDVQWHQLLLKQNQ